MNTRNIYWGLGIGDWGLGPIPNPQSTIPKSLSIKYKVLSIILLILKHLKNT